MDLTLAHWRAEEKVIIKVPLQANDPPPTSVALVGRCKYRPKDQEPGLLARLVAAWDPPSSPVPYNRATIFSERKMDQ